MPAIPTSYDENTWFAIESCLRLSDEQSDVFWGAVSGFEDDFDAMVKSMGRGFLLPSPPEGGGLYDAVDSEVASQVAEFFDECGRMRRRIADRAEAVVGEIGDLLSESQLLKMPAATRMARRAVWIGSLNATSRPPGIGRDVEAWIRLQYADITDGAGVEREQVLFEEMINAYSIRAESVARDLVDLSGDTSAGFILLTAGHDARIGGSIRPAAEGTYHLCDEVVSKSEEFFWLSDRLVNDLFSLGIAGFSDQLFHDWIDATTPDGIARVMVQPEIASRLAVVIPPTRQQDARRLAEQLRIGDIAAVLQMRKVYLECHFKAHRQCSRPYGVCGDACKRLAEMQLARLRAAIELFDGLLALADLEGLDQTLPEVSAARRHRGDLAALSSNYEEPSESTCGLIGRLGL